MKLAVVTATIDIRRAATCLMSWIDQAASPFGLYIVEQGVAHPFAWSVLQLRRDGAHTTAVGVSEILGVVPAFARGVAQALDDGAEVIACLHDDLEIRDHQWDTRVRRLFQAFPTCGLQGFGGGQGLGDSEMYRTPYHPMQLARQRFLSNMVHAEAHGERTLEAQRLACLDGFSQIGRREFWLGLKPGEEEEVKLERLAARRQIEERSLMGRLERLGVVHHAYDAALGAYAARLGWEVWLNPIACHHHGGLTAVADPRYHQWADQQKGTFEGTGDQKFWTEAHRIIYDEFRDVLPIRT